MKKLLQNGFVISILISIVVLSPLYSQIIEDRISNDALISSSLYDFGNYSDFSDNDPATQWKSAGVNPAFVQFEFQNQESVDSVSVYIGKMGEPPHWDSYIWCLEAADSDMDLLNKTNSYQLIIDFGTDTAGIWQSFKPKIPIEKKIWRFTIKRTIGGDNVHISELGLFRHIDVKSIKNRYILNAEEEANNVVIKASGSKLPINMFDRDINSGYLFNPEDSYYELQLSFTQIENIQSIKILAKNSCKSWLKSADNYTDLINGDNSFFETAKIEMKANNWDSIVFQEPLEKKHLNICFDKIEDSLTVLEVELYSNNIPEPLSGIQKELQLWEGWRWKNIPKKVIFYGRTGIPFSKLKWESTDTTVAGVDSAGQITAKKFGSADIIASYNDLCCSTKVSVKAKVKQSDKEIITGKLATPAENCVFEMPILIIRIIPTTDGINKDPSYYPEFWSSDIVSIDSIKVKTLKYINRFKLALEEGSKFRKYKYPDAISSIGIKIVDIINYYEPTGPGLKHTAYGNGILHYSTDYGKLFNDINLKYYVENMGVKQVWLMNSGLSAYSYGYNPDINRPENFRGNFESYMATPTPYQACNGINPEPLPIYNKTYTVISIDYSYPDFSPQNFEPFTHQFETLWQKQNELCDGSNTFFWKYFVGNIGRCGWTHCPPNTTINYGYWQYIQEDTNRVKPMLSDIEDWKPDSSGEKTLVSYHSWTDKIYNWYDGVTNFEGRNELQWFIYWLQSIPGYENNIPYFYNEKNYKMTNWWQFVYDWDTYTKEDIGLWKETQNSVYQDKEEFKVQISPNPAIDFIVINGISHFKTIQIINIFGQIIYETVNNNNNLTIDVTKYPIGCYYIKYADKILKFIKI